MTTRPILFSGPMVRALLDGRKTQTRRVMKPQPELQMNGFYHVRSPHGGLVNVPEEDVGTVAADYVPYAEGDRLYVREEFSGPYRVTGSPPRDWGEEDEIWYWADGNPSGGDWTRPKPGMHMPRWASRLTLTVTDVRVQRLREISDEDAKAEGVDGNPALDAGFNQYFDYLTAYRDLWDSLNEKRNKGAYAWARDPWVVAVSFTVEKRNIDALSTAKEPHNV